MYQKKISFCKRNKAIINNFSLSVINVSQAAYSVGTFPYCSLKHLAKYDTLEKPVA